MKHAACEALWEELERQICIQDGNIPVLEHPSVKYRKMIAQWRREIIGTTQDAVVDALDALAKGPMMEDDEE